VTNAPELSTTVLPTTPSIRPMAYDEELAARIRELLLDEDDVVEKKMFGGLAFVVDGHMAVSASGQGGLLVRIDPERADRYLGSGVEPMEMRGRSMLGWLRVDADVVRTKAQLRKWVGRGTAFVRTLPPKR
jgi:TfoX/Sxy family transcriptional regulator of competence genes